MVYSPNNHLHKEYYLLTILYYSNIIRFNYNIHTSYITYQSVQRENEQKLTTLSKELKATEQKSQKQRKNKNRDLVGFQQTIAHLNNLAQEIKRLELNNVACGDDIAEKRLGFVFDKCEHAVTSQVEGYLNVGEGLKVSLAILSS